MIRTFLEKRRVRREFEKLVAPEKVESLLRDCIERQPLKHGRIEFVLAFVRGETPAQVSERMARVADVAVANGAAVPNVVRSLVICAFCTHPASFPGHGSLPPQVRAFT